MTVIQRVDFIAMSKNFPDAQKLSGWQCQPANQVVDTGRGKGIADAADVNTEST